jgi:hypothetical protein
MANIKLDFSKMQHVKSDKNSTTLKHKVDGHEITLYHKALSPDNQQRLMALSGISKAASTPEEADQMAHKMAGGGNVSESIANKRIDATLPASSPTPSPTPSTQSSGPSTWDQIESGINNAGASIKQAVGAEAEGGEIKKPENTIDYSQFRGQQRPLPRGPSTELNYKDLKKQYRDKARQPMYDGGTPTSNTPATISGQATGGQIRGGDQNPGTPGHPGACPMCGGGTPRKGYANTPEQVSQNDSAPVMGPQTPSDSSGTSGSWDAPAGSPDMKKAATEQIYNRMTANAPSPDVMARIGIPEGDNTAVFGPQGQAPAAFSAQNWNKAKQEESKQELANANAVAGQQQQIIQENAARADAGLPPLAVPDVPQGPQVPGSPANPPPPNSINPSGQPVDTIDQGTQNMLTMSNQGFMNQQLGIMGTGAAQGALANEQARIYANQAKAEQNILGTYQHAYNSIDSEMDMVRNDIANSHITPENYWKGDKDGNGSHSKIASAIGMIVAGFNPTNQPNAAVNFLNKQMEMNLTAQTSEMIKKQNVLSSLQNKFRNMHDTMDFMRLTNAQMAQNQLGAAAAKATGGPNGLAAMAAQQAVGQLQQQYAPLQQKIAMSQTMMKMAGSPTGDPDLDVAQATKMARYATAMGNTDMAKQWQEATVPGIGVTKNLAPVPDKVRSQIATHKNLMNLLNQAQSLSQKSGTATSWDQIQGGRTLVNELTSALRTAEDQGVYKESDAKFLQSTIGSNPAGAMAAFTSSPQLKELISLKQNEFNTLLNTYNLPTRNTAPQQAPQTKTVNGVKYMRGPKGEAVPVR